jgi:hypothetical protein
MHMRPQACSQLRGFVLEQLLLQRRLKLLTYHRRNLKKWLTTELVSSRLKFKSGQLFQTSHCLVTASYFHLNAGGGVQMDQDMSLGNMKPATFLWRYSAFTGKSPLCQSLEGLVPESTES